VDLAQVEVAVAAAVYNDPDLIAMSNARDVYTQMAKAFFARELSPEALGLPDKKFKDRYGEMRDRMKVCTLATIYNITPYGLSALLGITVEQAARELGKFLGLFPALARAQREEVAYWAIRGYAYICTGLRRWRARRGAPSAWEINWALNTPVQGSAGVVFKVAGNRLYRRYQHYGARIILPLHDCFIFEAPKASLGQVAKVTAEVMRGAVQEHFPMLDPRVEINVDRPDCWNKDGKWRSLQLWLIDPELPHRLEACHGRLLGSLT
jgi:DNA polymerase-1